MIVHIYAKGITTCARSHSFQQTVELEQQGLAIRDVRDMGRRGGEDILMAILMILTNQLCAYVHMLQIYFNIKDVILMAAIALHEKCRSHMFHKSNFKYVNVSLSSAPNIISLALDPTLREDLLERKRGLTKKCYSGFLYPCHLCSTCTKSKAVSLLFNNIKKFPGHVISPKFWIYYQTSLL